MSSQYEVSDDLVAFIAEYERFHATAYRGQDNLNQTIGYGHVIQPGEYFSNGITKEEALALLKNELNGKYADAVRNWMEDNNITLTQQQFDALVSFSYNAGEDALNQATTLTNLLKSGVTSQEKIKGAFLLWVKVKVKDKDTGKVYRVNSKGLYRRRMDEWQMFTFGDYRRDYPTAPKGYQ
ncbi:lysozyme [Paenibacillus durus]|uniref:lysozyme n=1 Tax=Paenibacillus durus TaxID=44251 RepID=UPI0012E0BE9E|nr:lysozyme [Paenibacillus durus]